MDNETLLAEVSKIANGKVSLRQNRLYDAKDADTIADLRPKFSRDLLQFGGMIDQ